MSNKLNKNLGYLNWLRLVEAIECFTKKRLEENPRFFLYDGVDFLPAFERKTYFEIFGSSCYSKLFLGQTSPSETVRAKTPAHFDILVGIFGEIVLKPKGLKNYIKRTVFTIPFLFKIFLSLKRLKTITVPTPTQSEIGFICIHLKFVRYFELIYKNLNEATFIICDDI